MTLLEENKKFSESSLWSLQRKYFEQKGEQAWAGNVPYYVTNNSFFAESHAKLILTYINEAINNKVISAKKEIYLIEFGTGIGKFGYHFLTAFFRIITNFFPHLQNLKIRYVMTDFSEKNILFLRSHPQLKKFVKQGVLDFAFYDADYPGDIELLISNKMLSKKTLKNPLIAIGNYFFDGLKTDLFSFDNGEVREVLVNITGDKGALNDKKVNFQKIKCNFELSEIRKNYYDNDDLNKLLQFFSTKINKSRVLIPSTSLKVIEHLCKLSNGKIFFLTSDKGHDNINALEGLHDPHINIHGSFSLMVNFPAIAQYVKQIGGDYCSSENINGLTSALFSLGFKLDRFNYTKLSHQNYVEFNTTNFLNLKNNLKNNIGDARKSDVNILLSLLKLSNFDSKVFADIYDDLRKVINNSIPKVKNEIKNNLPRIADNHYQLPDNSQRDLFYLIAVLYYQLFEYDEAIKYYNKSSEIFGMSSSHYYNVGLCNYYNKSYQEALECFTKLLSIDSNDHEAQEWVKKIEKIISD